MDRTLDKSLAMMEVVSGFFKANLRSLSAMPALEEAVADFFALKCRLDMEPAPSHETMRLIEDLLRERADPMIHSLSLANPPFASGYKIARMVTDRG